VKTTAALFVITAMGVSALPTPVPVPPPAPVDPVAACRAELRDTTIERDLAVLKALKIIEEARAREAQHQHDVVNAAKWLHSLSLHCPKRGA
jgi:hypothetical protein